jgi:AraC-like DNA-binding protein
MLTANLVLTFIVVAILLKSHFGNNKGIVFAVLAYLSFHIKLLAEAFPISEFEQYPILLRLVLLHGLIGFLPIPLMVLYFQGINLRTLRIKPIYILMFVPFFLFLINLFPYFKLSLADQILLFIDPSSPVVDKSFLWIPLPAANIISDVFNTFLGVIIISFFFRELIQRRKLLNKKPFHTLFQLVLLIVINFIILNFLKYDIYVFDYLTVDNRELIALIQPLSLLLFHNFVYDNHTNSDLTFYLRLINHFSIKDDKLEDPDNEMIIASSRILNYLHNDKAYLSPGFSKHDIVTHLNIPQKTVTDCFSKVIKIPFPKLRNQLRIEHATELFRNNAHLTKTISGIAIDSGFQNRASFYIAFKEVMKMTPIEWIKENCEFELVEELEVASGEGSKSTAAKVNKSPAA